MAPSPSSIIQFVYKRLYDSFSYLTEGEISYGSTYSILRHSKPLVLYQGTKTSVEISVFGTKPLPSGRRVFLQRRGYRTGLLGWTLGGYLGGSKLPGIEVTPEKEESWVTHSQQRQKSFNKDVSRLFDPSQVPEQQLLQTMSVHIPVRSGDGYFRLRVTGEKPSDLLAESPPFRVGSLTWSSAHPQGATPVGLVPEILVRSGFLAAKTAAWTTFYAFFPFLKAAEYMPGPWGQRAMRFAYQLAGGDELKEKYRVTERVQRANDQFYELVPFGAAGVRTAVDLARDEESGRSGVWFDRVEK